MITGVCSLLIAGCNRGDSNSGEPLGARMATGSPPPSATPAAAVSQPASQPDVVSSAASLPAATYTVAQATRGQAIYTSTCARCHPPGQQSGPAFATAWNQRRVSDLYSILTNTMPQDKPGTLTDEQYIDVIAYMLKMNDVPASSTALRADTAALHAVKIDVKPAATQ
jgi:mono/diheme cytochrome c family protein